MGRLDKALETAEKMMAEEPTTRDEQQLVAGTLFEVLTAPRVDLPPTGSVWARLPEDD